MKTEAYFVWIIRLFKLVMLLVSGRGGTKSLLTYIELCRRHGRRHRCFIYADGMAVGIGVHVAYIELCRRLSRRHRSTLSTPLLLLHSFPSSVHHTRAYPDRESTHAATTSRRPDPPSPPGSARTAATPAVCAAALARPGSPPSTTVAPHRRHPRPATPLPPPAGHTAATTSRPHAPPRPPRPGPPCLDPAPASPRPRPPGHGSGRPTPLPGRPCYSGRPSAAAPAVPPRPLPRPCPGSSLVDRPAQPSSTQARFVVLHLRGVIIDVGAVGPRSSLR